MTDLIAPPCPRCGEVHQACGAHNRAGRPCRRSAIPGGRVCFYHGGNAPQVRDAAAERLRAETLATTIAQELAGIGRPLLEEHPIDGLLREVWRSAAAVEVYSQLVASLTMPAEASDLVDVLGMDDNGQPELEWRLDTFLGLNHQGEVVPHTVVKLWNEERERHARFCKLALDAGVAERMVRMAETQGQAIVSLIVTVLNDPELGLSDAQKALARSRAARELRSLPAR